MDVFADRFPLIHPVLRAAVIAAVRDGARGTGHRAEAIQRVLAAEALLEPLPAPEPVHGDWAQLPTILRSDTPLTYPVRYHDYLDDAGRKAAASLWASLASEPGDTLLDIGGGLGTYARAFLEARPGGEATLVEVPTIAARVEPNPRLRVVNGPYPVDTGPADVVLLANVLHMHGPAVAQDILTAAAAAARGLLVVKDYDPATLIGAYFNLSLAVHTPEGRLHDLDEIRAWMQDAGLTVGRSLLGPASVLVGHP